MGSSVRPMAPEQSVTKCNIFQGLKPPTRYDSMIDNIVIEMIVITYNEILNIYMTYG